MRSWMGPGRKSPQRCCYYGAFLQATIDFMLVALVIFLFIKVYNRVRRPAVEAPAEPAEEVLLLREIRDSLNN